MIWSCRRKNLNLNGCVGCMVDWKLIVSDFCPMKIWVCLLGKSLGNVRKFVRLISITTILHVYPTCTANHYEN